MTIMLYFLKYKKIDKIIPKCAKVIVLFLIHLLKYYYIYIDLIKSCHLLNLSYIYSMYSTIKFKYSFFFQKVSIIFKVC